MNFSIRTQLVACVIGLGLAMAAITGVAWTAHVIADGTMETVNRDRIVPLQQLKAIDDLYANSVVDGPERTLDGSVTFAESAKAADTVQDGVDSLWKEYMKSSHTSEERALADRARQAIADAKPAIVKLQEILHASDRVALEQFRRETLYQAIDPVSSAINDLTSLQVREARRIHDAFKGQNDERAVLIASVTAISVLVLLFAAWVIIFRVTVPVKRLNGVMIKLAKGDNSVEVPDAKRRDEIGQMASSVLVFRENAIEKLQRETEIERQKRDIEEERARTEAAKAREAEEDQTALAAMAQGLSAMASGDLTHRITVDFAARSERLKHDFNAAIRQLEDVMIGIASNAGSIDTGASEISQAADDLSRRTEQQAASLEETAAALDQITATVRKSAEGAARANAVVSDSRNDAQKGGEVVKSAVTAMSQIENSAQQISQIIGVIDEIAFQTNLLALNAGVEAARAGEAGKGFAVVASEVRALAQRSADAAKEIKALILASSRQVESGVSLVGQTGEALQRIVGQVSEISTLVSEIAASAREQAVGLSEVNTAVNQMDQVTQQNAAMVEQSTAASRSLANESSELNALVGRFRLSGRKPAVAVQPAARSHATIQMRAISQRKQLPAPADGGWEEF